MGNHLDDSFKVHVEDERCIIGDHDIHLDLIEDLVLVWHVRSVDSV